MSTYKPNPPGYSLSQLINYAHGTFSAFVLGGDAALIENGWAFGFHSGGPCTYYTRSLAAVRFAIAAGYTIAPEVEAAMSAHVDDSRWATNYDAERVARLKRDHECRMEHERARALLVTSARAKLTPQEYNAVVEEGRD